MPLILDPNQQLVFRRPFENGSTTNLKLTNQGDEIIAFKVKTTAPKQYCVRPNCGNIKPNESIDISVILQPMKTEPPPGFKCKDKFLVQSVVIKAEEIEMSSADLWVLVDGTRKKTVVEHKLRCVYLEKDEPETFPDPQSSISKSNSMMENAVSPTSPVVQGFVTGVPTSFNSSPAGPGNMTTLTSPISKLPTSPAPSSGGVAVETLGSVPGGKLGNSDMRARSASQPVPPPSIVEPVSTLPRSTDPAPKPPAMDDSERQRLENKCKALEAKVLRLENELKTKESQLETLHSQHTELRRRSIVPSSPGGTPASPQVITKTVVNPSYYSSQFVLIISVISFLIGVIVF